MGSDKGRENGPRVVEDDESVNGHSRSSEPDLSEAGLQELVVIRGQAHSTRASRDPMSLRHRRLDNGDCDQPQTILTSRLTFLETEPPCFKQNRAMLVGRTPYSVKDIWDVT